MKILEKILEEIEEYEKKKCSGESLSAFESGISRGCLEAESIIRSHMDEAPDSVGEKSILCTVDKDGVLSLYDDTYDVVIHCSNKEDQEQTVKFIEDSNWVPVEERLPETDDYILISFDNTSIIDIGRYEKDEDGGGAFYPGDEDKSYSSIGIFVNAWKPLPEPYKEGEHD